MSEDLDFPIENLATSDPDAFGTNRRPTQVKGPMAVLVGLIVVGFAGFINWWYFDMLAPVYFHPSLG